MSNKRDKARLKKEIDFSIEISTPKEEKPIYVPSVPKQYEEALIGEMNRLRDERAKDKEEEQKDKKDALKPVPKPFALPPIQDAITVRLKDGSVVSLFEAIQSGVDLTLQPKEVKDNS